MENAVQGEFAGQLAVVTGGAQGLGFAIARLLFERGASVALLDIDEVALAAAFDSLGDPLRVVPLVCDVIDETDLLDARQALLDRFGAIDVLINNAGSYPPASLRDLTPADWDKVFDVNAKSMWLATRTFMVPMEERKSGRIVAIVSTDATKAKPATPHYAAAKAAVANLIKTFALELASMYRRLRGLSCCWNRR